MLNFIFPLSVEQENGKPVCSSHQKKKKNPKHIHMTVDRVATYILFDTFGYHLLVSTLLITKSNHFTDIQ